MTVIDEIEKEAHDTKNTLCLINTLKQRTENHLDKLVELQLKFERLNNEKV